MMTIAYGGPAAVGFASLFCAGSPGPSFATALRVLIALRLGLVARLASSFARFVLAVANTAPVTLRQIGVLVVVFYFYVEVGLALYGPHRKRWRPALQESLFAKLGYDAVFDFDTFYSTWAYLFVVWVGNNWHVMMSGPEEAYGVATARLYFVSFYVLAILVVTNILCAFVLDCMDLQFDALANDSLDDSRRAKENWEVALDRLQRAKQRVGAVGEPVWTVVPKQRLLDFYRRLLATDVSDDLVSDVGLARAARGRRARGQNPGGWVSIDPFAHTGLPPSPWDTDQDPRRSISHA